MSEEEFEQEIPPENDPSGGDLKHSLSSEEVKRKIDELAGIDWVKAREVEGKSIHLLAKTDASNLAHSHSLVRQKLRSAWRKAHKADSEQDTLELTTLQAQLFDPIFSHFDTFQFCTTWKTQLEYRELYALHILNEIQGLRTHILRNNERLVESPELECRDQGFTRPRILVLVPFRNTALELVRCLGSLWTAMGGQVDNQNRLVEEFGPSEEDQESDQKQRATNQPPDFIHTFRENIDDCFRLGIKLTRKNMKLFCDFYTSDIIVASPLGMRMIIDGQSETKKISIIGTKRTKKKRIIKKGDFDFLSSIQTLVIDQADVIGMQNWDHLVHVINHINKLPKDSHGCDFSRVENVFLDGLAAGTRQNLIFSEYIFPELNSLVNGLSNCRDKWRQSNSLYSGMLKKIASTAKPEFHLIQSANLASLPQARFTYFIENILPLYSQSADHICIFIPSYLDFVQIREHFQSAELSHVVLSEYSTAQEISAARAKFFSGQARFLLATERFHFFKHYKIRGIRRLLFYSLPEHADCFEQWCSFLERKAETVTIPILLSPFDYLKTERIVGTSRIAKLIQ